VFLADFDVRLDEIYTLCVLFVKGEVLVNNSFRHDSVDEEDDVTDG
jgi:hypothetical protein